MSASSTVVSAAHFRYLAERTERDDSFVVELKRAAEAAGIPAIWISPEQASFMQILLRLHGAKQVVEVGTLAGYAAIQMARAIRPGGLVRTIELDPAHVAFAASWVAKSDVADRVEVIQGSGQAVLPNIEAGSVDAVFLDADKSGYAGYLEESLRFVRSGGLVMVDNAFAFGQLFDEAPTDGEVEAVRAFNDVMAREGRLQSIIVPIGDGLWVGVKK